MIKSSIHGYEFEGMYSDDAVIDLENKLISTYYFTPDEGTFAGFELYDVVTQKKEQVVAPHFEVGELSAYGVDEQILGAYESTRLIGFRSSLKCRTSQAILHVQPIYFSTSEQICTEALYSLDHGSSLKYEIADFGAECGAQQLMKAQTVQTFDDQLFRETHIFNGVTLTLVFAILLFLVALAILHVRNHRVRKRLEKKRKNLTLAN